jgi:TorA maturation chaperone TorD
MWDEPSRELLADFFGDGGAWTQLQRSLDKMNPRLPELQEGIRLMSDFLDQELSESSERPLVEVDVPDVDKEREKGLTDWRVEYARLFIGPGSFPCPPYESVYRERQEEGSFGNLMGETTLRVREIYRQAGLDLGTKQLPDYHCTELEFMGYLIGQEAEQYLAQDVRRAVGWQDFQESFLQDHLAQWLPEFCQDVQRETTLSYYQGLSQITAAYINIETERINQLKKAASSLFQ